MMLQFYQVCKKAMRRMLLHQVTNSDDDAVLLDPNALLGAPTDLISHHRTLQAVHPLCF